MAQRKVSSSNRHAFSDTVMHTRIPGKLHITNLLPLPIELDLLDHAPWIGTIEPLLSGSSVKYNSNRWDGGGFTAESTELAQAMQSLSCFSWHFTKKSSQLLDLQGLA